MELALYNWLAVQPSKLVDVEQLAVDLSQLPYPHATTVQVLILHHSIKRGGQGAVPYNGMMLTKDNGVRYSDINNLPPELIKILAAFIEMVRKLNG